MFTCSESGQEAEWGKWADRHQFVGQEAVSHQRQPVQRRLGLLDRVDVHKER